GGGGGSGGRLVLFEGERVGGGGKKVKPGQPVAAWPPKNARQAFRQAGMQPNAVSTFDVALQSHGTFDSPLLHMAAKVAVAWAEKGFTATSAIVSKAARDAQPCNGVFSGAQSGPDFVGATG